MTRLVDLTHPWTATSWSFAGLPMPIVTYVNRYPGSKACVMNVSTNMHTGTHIDAPYHFVPGGLDMAGIPLDQLYHDGAVVDVSDAVKEWDILLPEHVETKVKVQEGDILIVHYGWHDYYSGGPKANEEYYFCYQPGPDERFAHWALKKKLRWVGFDTGSADHPMNLPFLRDSRPDLIKEFEERRGRKLAEVFPPESAAVMHVKLLRQNLIHAENVGGDIDQVLNRRVRIGAFPWRFVGGDGGIARIVAFIEG